MKCITLLLDGAADRSYAELNNLTPLQYAHTPILDQLASQSQCGLMTVYREGVALGTDLAHQLLFNYQLEEYPSRTVFDLIGESVEIQRDALYLRCSIATVKKHNGFQLEHRFTPFLSDEEIKAMTPALEYSVDGFHFEFIHSYDSHGFIKVTGDVSDQISDSDPFRKGQYVMAVEPFETEEIKAVKTASAVNAYLHHSYDVLSKHGVNEQRQLGNQPIGNIILTKWAGIYRPVESFHIRNGLSGVIIGKSKLLYGIATYLKMGYRSYETFDEAITLALQAEEDYVHLHTKAPDEASHKKDPMRKVKALEEIDQKLAPLLAFEGLLIVTSDHSTPSSGRNIHSGESVAFMARGEYIRRDAVTQFNEIHCARGSLMLHGSDYMQYIINATDRSALYHLRQGKVKRHFILNEVNRLL